MRQALLISFLGRRRDRFTESGTPLPLREKLQLARRTPHVSGVEVVFPDEVDDAHQLQAECRRAGLAIAAVNVNLKGRPEFVRGALSSPDGTVRRQALDLLRRGKDFAAACGCPRVTCAPLADGSDYSLQTAYDKAWSHAVDTLGEAVRYHPEIALHLEHKPSDPRVRGLLSSADSVELMARECGAGITFNFGHALVTGAAPAEHWQRYHRAGYPLYVHFCDSSSSWDWDLLTGTHHWWSFVEFLSALRETGYDGWLTADTFPIHIDPLALMSANAEFTERWRRFQPPDRFPWRLA